MGTLGEPSLPVFWHRTWRGQDAPASCKTSPVVLKCILATACKISGPCFCTRATARCLTIAEAPRGNGSFSPCSVAACSNQLINFSRAKIEAAATAGSDSALVCWRSSTVRPIFKRDRRNSAGLANWSERAEGQSGFWLHKFSMARACPQASRRLTLPIFSYSSL